MNQAKLSYGIVADFMDKYDQFIKTNLEKGKLDEIRFIIGDVCLRGEEIVEMRIPLFEEKMAYAKYRLIMQDLKGLLQTEKVDERLLKLTFVSLDRNVADLDLILKNNLHYKENRRN
jgi:hypothetical protein